MRILTYLLICIIAVTEASVDLDVDWRDFISRSDPLWEFNTSDNKSMPTMWFDAPFHGNGNLGMLILSEKIQRNGKDKYVIRFDVGRADVWDVRMKGSTYAHGDRLDLCLTVNFNI